MPARKRPSDTTTDPQSTAPTKRRRSSNNNSTSTSRKHFHYLRARTRHISKNTITTKWTRLPPAAQSQIKELFRETKRATVLQSSRGDEKRRVEAEMALSAVVRKLESAVGSMVFPSLPLAGLTGNTTGGASGKAGEGLVDLGKWMKKNTMLNAELDPAIHAAEVLRGEIEKEEEALERETQLLKRLEENAKSEERAWKRREGKTHPLLAKVEAGAGDGAEDINLVAVDSIRVKEEPDEELGGVLGQLENHLESLKANADEVEGVDEAIVDARDALEGVLRERMGEDALNALMGLER